MKKQLLLLGTFIMLGFGALKAQDAPMRMTPEQRTKAALQKISEFKLDADANKKATAIFLDFYTAQQKAMEDMRASGNMDRDAMRTTRQKLAAERDEKLKAILTAEQLKKWTDELEPSLRPQRPAKD